MIQPLLRLLLPLLLGWGSLAHGQGPITAAPLPPLAIEDRGEMIMDGDEFSFVPWSSDKDPGKVHILQYFSGTISHRDLFSPFTDLLQAELDYTKYHVTTIINLDRALWGTKGFVVSELKDSKRQYPLATMVLDEDGVGVEQWQLGEQGSVLAIMGNDGVVQFVSHGPLDETQMQTSLELVRGEILEAEALALQDR
jgi:YtfJ family uncharacterized protein